MGTCLKVKRDTAEQCEYPVLFAWGPYGELLQNVSGHDHIPEGRFLDSVVVSG